MYSLYALLGTSRDLVHKNLGYPEARVVHLGAGVGMIPLTEPLLDALAQGRESSESGFEFLYPAVADWAERLSTGTPIAYVESEYIVGEGTEAAIVWRDGSVILGPLQGTNAINRALALMGVEAEPGRNEFEVVGLGKHRSPGEWVEGFRLDEC